MRRRGTRLLAAAAGTAFLVFADAAPALAHGIGGRADLPVPVSYFITAAGVAVVVSFLALAVLWPTPRLQADTRPSPGPGRPVNGAVAATLAVIGLAGLALVVLAGVFNREGGRTISPVLVWIYFWLVIPFVAAVAGNWWRAVSPFRLIATWINGEVPERPDGVRRIGMWPAVVAFVAFTWLELVSTSSSAPRTLALAAVVYSVYLVAGTRRLGLETGLSALGAFEAYNRTIGAIAPFEWVDAESEQPRHRHLRVRRRGWLRGLTALGDRPGFTAFVIAMIGTVSYDGASSSQWWSDTFGTVGREQWFGTLALLATIGVIGGAYWLACAVASSLADASMSPTGIARAFAHTLVPIALAYAFAHYVTLVVVEGQLLLHTASDPFGLGWNLFGTAGWRITWVPAPEVVWYMQVVTIVAGHVAGVVLAHDRALDEFGTRIAVRTQYAMLILMVALTVLGLLILSS